MITHSKQTVDLKLAADHTFAWSLDGRQRTDFGHWQLAGRYLVSRFSNAARGRKAGFPFRDKIIKVTPQELVYIQSKIPNRMLLA